jgi:hypothetical protein
VAAQRALRRLGARKVKTTHVPVVFDPLVSRSILDHIFEGVNGDSIYRGASFLAPLGNMEFVDGQFPATADVLVEVTALDAVHQTAEAWLRAQGEAEVDRFAGASFTNAAVARTSASVRSRSALSSTHVTDRSGLSDAVGTSQGYVTLGKSLGTSTTSPSGPDSSAAS